MTRFQYLLVTLLLMAIAPTIRAETPDLLFSHDIHAEAAECTDCHDQVATSINGRDDLLPTMETCAQCHDVDDENGCTQCHRNGDEPILMERIDDYLPRFTHKNHVDQLISCLTCHTGVNNSTGISESHLPPMSLCISCHDTPATFAGCALCHEPDRDLQPLDHKTGWMNAHSCSQLDQCSMCHTASSCEDCHMGSEGVILYHSSEFAQTHGMDFRMKTTECTLCHQDYSSCRTCHETNAIAPVSHLLPFYTANGHGLDAISDPDYCRVCHDTESSGLCATCH